MRGGSPGWCPTAPRHGILQDAGESAGGDRRGARRTGQGGVTEPRVDSYIAAPQALAELLPAARRKPRVAVDTEAASFHRYRDRIYLLQLSTRDRTALIDPLALADLAPFGALLADAQVEKVFHDADYDLRVLDRDYGFRAVRLFDTRIAAQLAGEPAIGLAALLDKYLGIKLAKEHQKADWSLRPLPPEMLAYAAADTRHLLDLRDALERRLHELGRLAWAGEEFGRVEGLRWWRAPSRSRNATCRGSSARRGTPRIPISTPGSTGYTRCGPASRPSRGPSPP